MSNVPVEESEQLDLFPVFGAFLPSSVYKAALQFGRHNFICCNMFCHWLEEKSNILIHPFIFCTICSVTDDLDLILAGRKTNNPFTLRFIPKDNFESSSNLASIFW